MDLLEQLTIEDLSEEQRELASLIGMPAYLKLVNSYAGNGIYIPTKSSLLSPVRDRLIKSEYSQGIGYKDIAIKYGLTANWVRQIIHGEYTRSPMDGQISIEEIV